VAVDRVRDQLKTIVSSMACIIPGSCRSRQQSSMVLRRWRRGRGGSRISRTRGSSESIRRAFRQGASFTSVGRGLRASEHCDRRQHTYGASRCGRCRKRAASLGARPVTAQLRRSRLPMSVKFKGFGDGHRWSSITSGSVDGDG